MPNNKSVLVIEDHEGLALNYRIMLKNAGFDAVITDTKQGAIDHLRDRTFAIAIVDLQLRDDVTHKGGIDVLEYLRTANEGTNAIVVSGTPEVGDVVASYQAGITAFIQKGTHDPEYIINSITNVIDSASRPLYGKYPSLAAYLAAPVLAPIWQAKIVEITESSYENLNQMLWKEFKSYLPLLRKADGTESFDFHADKKAISGLFWSKGAGFPIWFSACAPGGQLVPPPADLNSQLMREQSYRKNTAAVWRVAGVPRNLFPEFSFETPWEQPAKSA